VDWSKLFSFFKGHINIEKVYKDCDKALDVLRKYEKNPDAFDEEKKKEMQETVQYAYDKVERLLSKEDEKNWPGVFREMHKNLANIYMYEGKYQKSREECEKLREFGEVGRLDAEEVMKELKEREEETNNTE